MKGFNTFVFRMFGVLKCSTQVGNGMSDEDTGETMTGNVPAYASGLMFLGAWGLVLAVLNMFSLAHPTYRISWGGLLTLEATNAAFGEAKDGFYFEPLGDAVFIAICAVMIYIGGTTINSRTELVDWVKGLFVNDTWPALNDPSLAGGQRTLAAWCLLLGLGFYLYFGIAHHGWIDVGVYSVAIALMASGFALNHASRVPPGDENID